jgi:hypothetical protein
VGGRGPGAPHDAYFLDPIEAQAGEQEDFTFHMAKRIEPGHEA